MPRQPRHRASTGRHRNRVNEHIVNFIFNMCRMLDRVTDTFLQPSQRKCSCSSRLLGMAFQLRRCLAFLQPFFFLHSGLWHCRHVLQCIHKSIKNNRKCYQLYIKNHRCVGITLDFLLLFFSVVSYNFVLLLVSFWCSLPPFWAPFGALGLSFGTLGPSFGALGPQVGKKQIWRKLGENSGSKSDFILSIICICF